MLKYLSKMAGRHVIPIGNIVSAKGQPICERPIEQSDEEFRSTFNRCYPIRLGPATDNPLISIEDIKKLASAISLSPELLQAKINIAYPTKISPRDNSLITAAEFDTAIGSYLRETTFRKKLESAYPTKIGLNGILSTRDFTQALLKVLDEETLKKLLDRLPSTTLEETSFLRHYNKLVINKPSLKYSFYASGPQLDKRFLTYSGGPPTVTSDEIPAVLPSPLTLHILTFTNSRVGSTATLYLFKNMAMELGLPDVSRAIYHITVPGERVWTAIIPTGLQWATGETISVYLNDTMKTTTNATVELYFSPV